MYSELIHTFTENTDYSFNLDIDVKTKNSIEAFSDLEDRTFSLKDCWEFNGFVDGSYLGVSANKKISTIKKMGSEYGVLVNEFLDNQVLARMNESLGEDYSRIFHVYSELEKLTIEGVALGRDHNINIFPTWNLIIEDNSEFELYDQNELLEIGRRFDDKYKSGFQTGMDLGFNTPSKELEKYYENQDLTLPFSAEYIILASEENY
jgi:hypothetical protein